MLVFPRVRASMRQSHCAELRNNRKSLGLGSNASSVWNGPLVPSKADLSVLIGRPSTTECHATGVCLLWAIDAVSMC